MRLYEVITRNEDASSGDNSSQDGDNCEYVFNVEYVLVPDGQNNEHGLKI